MLRVILHIQGFKEIVHMLHENLRTALFQSAHLQAKRHEPTPDIIYQEVEVLAAPLIRLIPSSFFTASSREGLVGDTVLSLCQRSALNAARLAILPNMGGS
jgi:hypothetical protein